MKKPIKIVLILLVSSICLLVSISVYNKMKVKNIFDEIYYDSRHATGEGLNKRSSLGNIKGMSISATNLSSENEKIIVETYKSENLKPPMKRLSIMNNSTKKSLDINFSYQVTSNTTIFFENDYNVEEKKLTRKITFVETDSGKRFTTKKEVKEMLSQCELTEKQLKIWDEQGMNQVFLKDWVSVYPSRFSPDKLGDVEIKTEW